MNTINKNNFILSLIFAGALFGFASKSINAEKEPDITITFQVNTKAGVIKALDVLANKFLDGSDKEACLKLIETIRNNTNISGFHIRGALRAYKIDENKWEKALQNFSTEFKLEGDLDTLQNLLNSKSNPVTLSNQIASYFSNLK